MGEIRMKDPFWIACSIASLCAASIAPPGINVILVLTAIFYWKMSIYR